MTRRTSRQTIGGGLLGFCFAISGCWQEATSHGPLLSDPTGQSPLLADVATLEVSDVNPAIGSVITVSARVRTAKNAPAIGSFNVRLAYDPEALQVLGDSVRVNVPSGVNASVPGVLRVAGASALGVGDQPLFSAQFIVRQRAALQGLSLSFSELAGVDLHSRSANVMWDAELKEVRTVNMRVRP